MLLFAQISLLLVLRVSISIAFVNAIAHANPFERKFVHYIY
jgi:hypothetical protein